MSMEAPAAGLLVLALMTRCSGGGCDDGASFSNAMVSAGGHSTPQAALEAAAEEPAANYPFDVPGEGWSVVRGTETQQTSRAGDVEMTVLRLQDETWLVEAGRCVSG